MPRKIYVASSWRNVIEPNIVTLLKQAGHEVYDFRNPAPGNTGFKWDGVDAAWCSWVPRVFAKLVHEHPAAQAGFKLDKDALDWCDTCVLLLPSGRSAHLEAGYAIGQGKDTIVFLTGDGFEPELMYELGHGYVFTAAEMLERLRDPLPEVAVDRVARPELEGPMQADEFQKRCWSWAVDVHGQRAQDKTERADRFLEEAIELFEAVGQPRERAHALVDYVYSRGKRGEIAQEIGGVLVTLASLAERWGIAMAACGNGELHRIEAPEVRLRIREKGASKPFGQELVTQGFVPAKPSEPVGTHRCPRRDESPMGRHEASRGTEATPDHWRSSHRGSGLRTCSYCGSVHPDEFMAHVRNCGKVHGTDKNYKAYIMPSHDKFYFQHLSEGHKIEFIGLMNEGKTGWLYVDPFFVARKPVEHKHG